MKDTRLTALPCCRSPAAAARRRECLASSVSRLANGRCSWPVTFEPREVLVGDVGVGADVDDVDAVDAVVVLQVLNRPGDDAARDQALAQAGLVGDQEAPARLRLR